MIEIFKYYKPGLGQSWWLVALLFVGSIVGGGINMIWKDAPQSLTYLVMMALPLLWCLWQGHLAARAGGRALAIDQPHFGKLTAGIFLPLSAIALLTLTYVMEPTTSFIPMPDSIKAIFEEAFMKSSLWDMIASTWILAPLLEELLCRGIMMRGMLTRMKPGRAIFWSALIFAVMHLNPWQSIPAFLSGLLLGWIYWRTHSLWTTVFLHCLNNSLSTAILRLYPDVSIDACWKDILPPTTYWTVYAVCAIAFVLSLYLLHEKTVSAEIQGRVEA